MKKVWQTRTLGDLCEIELGKTPSRANASLWDEKRETNNVWLSIADLLKAEDNVVVDSKEYVSDKGAAICKRVPKGTLLVSFKLTLGRLAFAGRDLFTNEAIAALTIFNERELSKEFLFYCLTFFDWVKAAENDVKLKGMTLNKAKLKVMPVSFPPLAEQQRIVGVLDEAFAGLATAQAHAAQNLQNARALFESHLQSVFTHRGKGWVEKELGELCEFENGDRGTNYPNKSARTASGIPFINAGHLTEFGLDMERMDFISKERFDLLGAGKVQPKDILFCLRGSLGKYASVGDLPAGAIASSLVIVRPRPTILDRFVLAYFGSPICAAMVNRFKNGAAQPNLSANSLKKFVIPVPPLAEQERIVTQLDALAAETQRLTRIYEQKQAALAALKKSLLHQAFSGAL